MMSQTQWAGFSVHDFFKGYNWSGEQPKLESLALPEEDSASLLELSVGEFFNQSNWRGKPSLNPSTQASPMLAITLPMSEFFWQMNWKGQSSKTAPVVTPTQPQTLSPSSSDYTLTNLSDLF